MAHWDKLWPEEGIIVLDTSGPVWLGALDYFGSSTVGSSSLPQYLVLNGKTP